MNEKLKTLGFTKEEVETLLKGEKILILQRDKTPSFLAYLDNGFLKIKRTLDNKIVTEGIIKL